MRSRFSTRLWYLKDEIRLTWLWFTPRERLGIVFTFFFILVMI